MSDRHRAGDHVPDEVPVPGNVDDPYHAVAGQEARREAQVDRKAALLLLGQAVHDAAGEDLHERALAVGDVAGRADHGVDDVGPFRLRRLLCSHLVTSGLATDSADFRK
jgi:hypothetical protein